ncbi:MULTISPECIES: hypothetical protein [Pseudomonadaceae]|uniref:hypothetical protein n=1 Tax=Pseudomonadaceae TaxID=135621 RepID=UPI00084B1B29|nr:MULTISPECIES: hypothetical protein [Pseudomonas]OEC59461.1 hypothetical protein A9G05_11135 [Pseudomonas sp. ENNP23]
MYPNRKHLNDVEIKIRVDEETAERIEGWARFRKAQRAAFCRELLKTQLDLLEQLEGELTDEQKQG